MDTMITAGLMTLTDAARYLGVSRGTVYALMGQGRIPWVRVGARRKVRRADLEQHLTDNTYNCKKDETK